MILTINNITFDYSEVKSFEYTESPDVSGEIVLKDGRIIKFKSVAPDLLKLAETMVINGETFKTNDLIWQD